MHQLGGQQGGCKQYSSTCSHKHYGFFATKRQHHHTLIQINPSIITTTSAASAFAQSHELVRNRQ
jgi:hypothetical protein